MELNGVRIEILEEPKHEKLYRVVQYFDFHTKHLYTRDGLIQNYAGCDIYVEIITSRKYFSFLKLFSFSRVIKHRKSLGVLNKDYGIFFVYHRDNLPLASIFVKKLSEELGYKIVINLKEDKSAERIGYNVDDSHFLNIRRQFLEKEQLRSKQENERIESELADVHKKLQALSGGGGPYRALSAVE